MSEREKPAAWMRDVGSIAKDGEYDECLVVCSKCDPDAFPVFRNATFSKTTHVKLATIKDT